MECRAMGNTSTKPTTNPETCPLSAFDGIPWGQIPKEGQKRIFYAYRDYFDKQSPRNRAIGYCVIMGGITPRKIGTLGAMLCRDNSGQRLFGVTIEGKVALIEDPFVEGAIDAYARGEQRFADIWAALPAGGRAVVPLFVALRNGKHEALADCLNIMWKAALAIGYNARSIKTHKMAVCPIQPFPWKPDDPRFNTLFLALGGDNSSHDALHEGIIEECKSKSFLGFYSVCAGLWAINPEKKS